MRWIGLRELGEQDVHLWVELGGKTGLIGAQMHTEDEVEARERPRMVHGSGVRNGSKCHLIDAFENAPPAARRAIPRPGVLFEDDRERIRSGAGLSDGSARANRAA